MPSEGSVGRGKRFLMGRGMARCGLVAEWESREGEAWEKWTCGMSTRGCLQN